MRCDRTFEDTNDCDNCHKYNLPCTITPDDENPPLYDSPVNFGPGAFRAPDNTHLFTSIASPEEPVREAADAMSHGMMNPAINTHIFDHHMEERLSVLVSTPTAPSSGAVGAVEAN